MADGTAFHKGAALLRAGARLDEAQDVAITELNKEIAKMTTIPELDFKKDDNRELVRAMLKMTHDGWSKDQGGIQVIQPECKFDIALPNSMHNCIWEHARFLPTGGGYVDGPLEMFDPEEILRGNVVSPHHKDDPSCACWRPHRITGTTDTIFTLRHHVFIEDHKTTALNSNQFWAQWPLDMQMTIYMWAIKQTLGFTPAGFFINAIFRPSQAQLANWNKNRKEGEWRSEVSYLRYERELFLRTDFDLDRAAQVMTEFGHEWEWRITHGYFGGTFGANACVIYNRPCEYTQMCKTGDRDRNALVTITPEMEKEKERK